jgi:hypothetical protein
MGLGVGRTSQGAAHLFAGRRESLAAVSRSFDQHEDDEDDHTTRDEPEDGSENV